MPDAFPPEIRRFIEQRIESLGQLEALLLLHREPERRWHPEQIAKALYVPIDVAAGLLAEFAKQGFATVVSSEEPQFSYRSNDAETHRLIDRLAAIYQERRVAVISMIYSKPMNKVQTFADAFRLRKES